VLKRAIAEERILVTFHKDFAELAFRSRLPAQCGIILLRIPEQSPAYIAKIEVIIQEAEERGLWAEVPSIPSRILPLSFCVSRPLYLVTNRSILTINDIQAYIVHEYNGSRC
jgi:hypothetical protein